MSTYRTFKNSNICNITVFSVGFGLVFCFFIYIFQFLFGLNASFKFIVLPLETILFVLLSWTFLKVYLIQPGTPPLFWSIEVQNKFNKDMQQRRYCLICKNFKPQRSHHCSTCGKCILNLDHHCPWVNNCIGFYNRKFFILFLIYLLVNLLFILPQQGYLIVQQLIPIFKKQNVTNIHTGIRVLTFLGQLFLFFPILTFIGYHWTLVRKNQTTIMELKRQRDLKNNVKLDQFNPYDVGSSNFSQVFGQQAWAYFLPVNSNLSCDGIHWPKQYKKYFQI